MSIFLDTGYVVALTNEGDINHEKAAAVSKSIINGELGNVFLSNYVFDELVTHIMIRQNHSKAREVGQAILESDITILPILETNFDEAWKIFAENKNLSFTDCTTIQLIRENRIKHLASFDKEFKRFKEMNILF